MSRKIIITEEDNVKLRKLVDEEIVGFRVKPHVMDLDAELRRAQIVEKEELPQDVITMNSTVLLLLDGVEETVSLVYPHEADMSHNRISIFSPIGTAIIGYREGDVIEWVVPSGTTIINIKKVLYQPESAEKVSSLSE